MGTEREFPWGGGHRMQCADGVLSSCTLEIYMVLQTKVIPIILIFLKKYQSHMDYKGRKKLSLEMIYFICIKFQTTDILFGLIRALKYFLDIISI